MHETHHTHPRWNSEYRLSGAPLIMSLAVAGSRRASSMRMTMPVVASGGKEMALVRGINYSGYIMPAARNRQESTNTQSQINETRSTK